MMSDSIQKLKESHFVPYLMNYQSDSHNWMYKERLSWMAAIIYQNIKYKLGHVILYSIKYDKWRKILSSFTGFSSAL
jgi:hypothetical protein